MDFKTCKYCFSLKSRSTPPLKLAPDNCCQTKHYYDGYNDSGILVLFYQSAQNSSIILLIYLPTYLPLLSVWIHTSFLPQWFIIHYCPKLFWGSNYPIFSYLDSLKLAPASLWHVPIHMYLVMTYLLAYQDIPGSFCTYIVQPFLQGALILYSENWY